MSEVWTEGAGFGALGAVAPWWDALCVGDAVLETVRRGGDGRWLFAPEHAARAAQTWRASFAAAPGLAERLEGALEALDDAPESWSAMRLFVTPDASGSPRIWASRIAWQPPTEQDYLRGARCVRSAIAHPGLGGLGKTASYHWARGAQREARARGATDALLAGPGGALIEAATAALVWREGARWFTPAGPSLKSVTLAALAEEGGPLHGLEEARADCARLERADEALLLSSLRLAIRVASLGERTWPAGETDQAWRTYLLTRGRLR